MLSRMCSEKIREIAQGEQRSVDISSLRVSPAFCENEEAEASIDRRLAFPSRLWEKANYSEVAWLVKCH